MSDINFEAPEHIYLVDSCDYEGSKDWVEDLNDVMYQDNDPIEYTLKSAHDKEIAALREEVERLNGLISEMSELCLTNAEVDKIKADTISDAVEAYFCSGSMSADDLKVFMRNYVDKLRNS